MLKFRYAKVLAFVLFHTVVLKAQNPETLSLEQADTLRQSPIAIDTVAVDSAATPAASVPRSDIETTITKMHQLRDLGLRFALDDFGTGYSSLSYLKRLPFDLLKIDQSFTRDMLNDNTSSAIVRAILVMSDALGLEVVAEGVETVAQRAFLISHGCHFCQGYLLGRPVPIEAWEATHIARPGTSTL